MTPPSEQAAMLGALLSFSDDETQAMYWRLVEARQRRARCAHIDSWTIMGRVAVCDACGLPAWERDYPALVRWPAPKAEPAEAIGSALAEWEPPSMPPLVWKRSPP